MNVKLLIYSIIIAVILAGGAFFLKNRNIKRSDSASTSDLASVINNLESGDINKKYFFEVALGDPGSEHSHANMMFFIDGKRVDFAKQEYMLRDRRMHFEDNDGLTIHKHATGVNLPVFFASLDIRINQDCFMPDITKEYCSDGEKTLTFIVNGQISKDVYSELRDGDRILVNYGDDSPADLQDRFNSIPKPPSQQKTQ